MWKIRQINIKNQTYYFYNDHINLKDFDVKNWHKKLQRDWRLFTLGISQRKKLMIDWWVLCT